MGVEPWRFTNRLHVFLGSVPLWALCRRVYVSAVFMVIVEKNPPLKLRDGAKFEIHGANRNQKSVYP